MPSYSHLTAFPSESLTILHILANTDLPSAALYGTLLSATGLYEGVSRTPTCILLRCVAHCCPRPVSMNGCNEQHKENIFLDGCETERAKAVTTDGRATRGTEAGADIRGLR